MYIPNEIYQLNTAMKLLVVDHYENDGGEKIPVYKEAEDDPIIFCNFKSRGGSEKVIDGRYVIEDTADIVTFFRPDIKSDCLLIRLKDNAKYEIINEPENVEERDQYLKFKIKRLKGKA